MIINPRILVGQWAVSGAADPRDLSALMCANRDWHTALCSDLPRLLQSHLETSVFSAAPGLLDKDAMSSTLDIRFPIAPILLASYIRVPTLVDAVKALASADCRDRHVRSWRKALECFLDGSLWWMPTTTDGDGEGCGVQLRATNTIMVLSILTLHSILRYDAGNADSRAWPVYAMFHFVGRMLSTGRWTTIDTGGVFARVMLDQVEALMEAAWPSSGSNARIYHRLKWLMLRVRSKLRRHIEPAVKMAD